MCRRRDLEGGYIHFGLAYQVNFCPCCGMTGTLIILYIADDTLDVKSSTISLGKHSNAGPGIGLVTAPSLHA